MRLLQSSVKWKMSSHFRLKSVNMRGPQLQVHLAKIVASATRSRLIAWHSINPAGKILEVSGNVAYT